MPSVTNEPTDATKTLTVWNRKLHYYVGLYLLLFIWLFALTGLLLNHHWKFAEFYPNRHTSNFERRIRLPVPSSDVEDARDIMRQLGIEGEVGAVKRPESYRFEYNVSRPGHVYQIQTDLNLGVARVMEIEYNGWGIMRTLHTFSGASLTDTKFRRDWALTTIWAISMDAVAAGLVFMVFSSYYMWWRLPKKRTPGMVALALGTMVCGLFVFGLRWLYR